MYRLHLSFFFLSCLALYSCSSGKKSFEQGDYYQAVLKSVSRLRQNPSHRKSRETLKQSYPLAIETFERDAKNAISSDAEFKYREAFRSYEKINRLYEEIRRSPGALRVIPKPIEYYTRVGTLKEQAAEESYDAGITALEKDTRNDAKEAYYRFKDAQEFVNDYKDITAKLEESKDRATLKVIIEPIPVPIQYDLNSDFFQKKIERYLKRPSQSLFFVDFYTPHEAETEQLPQVDHFLRLQFDEFALGKAETSRVTESVKRDSVVVGTVKRKDGSKENVYRTVKATVTTYTKSLPSEGSLSLEILEGNPSTSIKRQTFNGSYVWTSKWGVFKGDERALSDEQKRTCKRKEKATPSTQQMFESMSDPIYRNLTRSINAFYASY